MKTTGACVASKYLSKCMYLIVIIVFQAHNFWLGSYFQTTILACFEMCLWVSELGVDDCTTPLLAWFSQERDT
jgi:hypothetical protein